MERIFKHIHAQSCYNCKLWSVGGGFAERLVCGRFRNSVEVDENNFCEHIEMKHERPMSCKDCKYVDVEGSFGGGFVCCIDKEHERHVDQTTICNLFEKRTPRTDTKTIQQKEDQQ